MTPTQEAELLTEHQPKELALSNGKKCVITPFTMEHFLEGKLVESLQTVASAIWYQAKMFLAGDSLSPANLEKLNIVGAILASREGMKYCITSAVNLPLAEIPLADLPRVLEVIVRQNFQSAQLASWADLFSTIAGVAKAARKNGSTSTSATPASSYSTMATADGAATPLPSSNTGSGAA